MQAIIFAELKKYAEARLGADAWLRLLREAGVTRPVYAPGQDYPDEEAGTIVAAASKETGLEPDAILQDFGEFIAPDLVRMYRHIIDPKWKTLDLIEHTEETIHKAVRRDHPAASPPQLKCVRKAPDEVIIHYGSRRRMCGVAKGIARGLARHYGEKISLRADLPAEGRGGVPDSRQTRKLAHCSFLGTRPRRSSRQTGGYSLETAPPRAHSRSPPCRSRRSESAARCRAALLQSAKALRRLLFAPSSVRVLSVRSPRPPR